VHGAGACRALCVEAEVEDVASPGTMLAPALSTDREQQQQHIHTPASAKDALVQHHAHHCSVCEAARHTQQASKHIRAHTRTHTHILHTRMYTYKHKRLRILTYAHTRTHIIHTRMYTHTNTNAHEYSQTRTHTYTCTRTNTQTHAQAHTHTHAHMHMHAHVARVMGFAYFSASLATLPHCPVGFTACTCVHVCVRACVCVCVWRAACDVQVNLCTSANLSPLSLCASYALQMCACMCV